MTLKTNMTTTDAMESWRYFPIAVEFPLEEPEAYMVHTNKKVVAAVQ